MKRIKFIICCGLLLGALFPAKAADMVSMVTYFPVPYVAYNTLYVKDKLDIGTYKGPFTLTLGNPQHDSLVANDVLLRAVDGSTSTLSFGGAGSNGNNGILYTQQATFGKPAGAQPAELSFENLTINKMLGSSERPVANTVAGSLNVVGNKMYLNTNGFTNKENAALPACADDKGVPQNVQWQKHKIDGEDKYLLVCGGFDCEEGYEREGDECKATCNVEEYLINNVSECESEYRDKCENDPEFFDRQIKQCCEWVNDDDSRCYREALLYRRWAYIRLGSSSSSCGERIKETTYYTGGDNEHPHNYTIGDEFYGRACLDWFSCETVWADELANADEQTCGIPTDCITYRQYMDTYSGFSMTCDEEEFPYDCTRFEEKMRSSGKKSYTCFQCLGTTKVDDEDGKTKHINMAFKQTCFIGKVRKEETLP